jgi:hypothetical protein
MRSTADEDRPPVAWSVVLPVLAAKAMAHALALVNYGYFRDELYYLAFTRPLGDDTAQGDIAIVRPVARRGHRACGRVCAPLYRCGCADPSGPLASQRAERVPEIVQITQKFGDILP